MATISNTPRPGYVWDSTDNVWYPIGTGSHNHSEIPSTIVDAKGDIIAATAADTVSRLAVGSNDQVLTADSTTATGLKWATPSAGGMTLISETTASALSSLSLSSIPGTYKQLLLLWSGIYHSGTGSNFSIRLNNDSTTNAYGGIAQTSISSTYTNLYWEENAIKNIIGSETVYPFGNSTNNSTTAVYTQAHGILLIDNYASSTKYKFFDVFFNYYNNSSAKWVTAKQPGVWLNTSAITSIDVVRETGTQTFSNRTNTSIRLYGVS